MKIGHAANAEQDAHIQIANAASSENDVLIVLYSGNTREVVKVAQLARSKKAKVIVISHITFCFRQIR